MYKLQDVEKIVQGVVKLSEKKENEIRRILTAVTKRSKAQIEPEDYPEYFSFYGEACEMRDHIQWHAEKCKFPSMLFRKRAPRMTQDEYEYIEMNFKQTSLPVYLDFHSTVNRILNDTSWSQTFPKAAEEEGSKEFSFKKYVMEQVPEYGSLENFFKSYLPHLKLTDSVGCLVMRPKDFPTTRATTDPENTDAAGSPAEGNQADATAGVLDNSKPFEPMPFYFRCDQLVGYATGKYFLFESDNRSEVMYGNKLQKLGRVFEFYDENQIVFIRQVGNYTDQKFEATVMLEHKWGRTPVEFLKGVPKITKDGTLWISPFYYAVDLLDLVLLNETNLQTSINSCVYPFRIMEGNECDFEVDIGDGNMVQCEEGWIIDQLHNTRYKCQSCQGSGLKSNMSPLGVMLVKKATQLDENTKSSLSAPMMFISPGTEPLEFLKKKIAEDEHKARRILHLQNSSSDVQPGEGETPALKSVLDLKALYAFLKTISDQMFDLYYFMYEASAMYLYGAVDYQKYLPTLAYPVSYDFKTEGDYLQEIAAATEANLPPMVIHTIIYRYLSALYFNDPKTSAIFLLLLGTDRLLIFSRDDINTMRREGDAADWEVLLHDSGLSIIDQLAQENDDFFDDKSNPFSKRKEQVIARAKELSDTAQAERTAKADAEAQRSVDSIMGKLKQKKDPAFEGAAA